MAWKIRERLKAQLESEKGYVVYPPGTRDRFALCYPNSYFVGMSNLGLHIIYDILNKKRSDTACERFFLPSGEEAVLYRKEKAPLLSMETQSPLHQFDIVAFALSYEMDYFHVLSMLRLGKVKLFSRDRDARDPIVIAGGPCATFNPEPLADVIDAFIIGEGEETIQRFMDAYRCGKADGLSRGELLLLFARVPGVYVPSLYKHEYAEESGRLSSITVLDGAPEHVHRQWVRRIDDYPGHTAIVTDNTEFNLYLIETARGCGRHCRFCMAGYCFRRPRNRSLESLKAQVQEAKPYGKRIGLMGAAISDYPEINALSQYILDEGLGMSVASFRADSVTRELMAALASSGLRTVTLAPEAGSVRMRAVINKGIEEKHLFQAIDLGVEAGIRQFKLYLMIGLPDETAEDIAAITDMVQRLHDYILEKIRHVQLTLSVNPFVPKPFTPFQWKSMASKQWIEKSFKEIRTSLRHLKGLKIITESPKEAIIQSVLARGDRRVGAALARAVMEYDGSKGFLKAMKDEGLTADFYIYREREETELFPWESLHMGFTREYLYGELKQALAERGTKPCFAGCRRCGVCTKEDGLQ
ncbi:radical SAM protein [Selenomonas sp. TAMA-11512]|uniref:TIGR03960 family B12-binding radical SAM protein n=1 Tax=Selenomonas sp. TAMA-11512 TaxID=3095337 RepID=UPI0030893F18|nr:radical SAM protein [Selenomonas sp. TAMA-11512]